MRRIICSENTLHSRALITDECSDFYAALCRLDRWIVQRELVSIAIGEALWHWREHARTHTHTHARARHKMSNVIVLKKHSDCRTPTLAIKGPGYLRTLGHEGRRAYYVEHLNPAAFHP